MSVNNYTPLLEPYVLKEHFTLQTSWEESHANGTIQAHPCPCVIGRKKFIIDPITQDRYLNDPSWLVTFKCFALTLASPLCHALALPLSGAYRCLSLCKGTQKNNIEKTIALIVATPLLYVGLCFSSIYGIFSPYNGRKLYATLERVAYEGAVLAPCFQPSNELIDREQLLPYHKK